MDKPKSRARKQQQPANPKKRKPQPERQPERIPPTVFDQDDGGPDDDVWDVDDSDLRNRW